MKAQLLVALLANGACFIMPAVALAVGEPAQATPSAAPVSTPDYPVYPGHPPPPGDASDINAPSPLPEGKYPARAGDRTTEEDLTPLSDVGVRTHDGFYLRFVLGAGSLKLDLDGYNLHAGSATKYSAAEGEAMTDLMLGGTIAKRLVIGGGLLAAGETPFSSSERSLSGYFAFVDWFPNPHGGFHVGAGVGHGTAEYSGQPYHLAEDRLLRVFTGYDVWVTDQWSAGVVLGWAGLLQERLRAQLWSAAATLLYH